MKKILVLMLAALMLLAIFTVNTALATDNGEDDRIEALDAAISEGSDAGAVVITAPEDVPTPSGEPALPESFTWKYLITTGGAAIFVFFVVKFAKAPIDKIGHIPTRLLVYILCLLAVTTSSQKYHKQRNN